MQLRWYQALTVSLAVLMITALVASPLSAAPPDKSASEQEVQIRDLLDNQIAAWNRGDLRAFMFGYWDSDKLEFIGAGGIVRGWKQVLQRYQSAYPDVASMGRLSFTNLEVNLVCPESAYVVGEYQLWRANDVRSGVFTLELKKSFDGWKIVVDHSTSYPKPANP
jgi:ketosteroid isomerase-like protein